MAGVGHPFAYFSQEAIEGQDDEDVTRIVAEYDPAQELVIVLLDRISTYKVTRRQAHADFGNSKARIRLEIALRQAQGNLEPGFEM